MKKTLLKYTLILFLICLNTDVFAQAIIRTIAGYGQQLYDGDGGPAVLANIGNVFSVAVDDSGNVFSCDNYFNNIRKIAHDGMISTFCGNGYPAYSGDGGICTAAQIASPFSLAYDGSYNLHIADAANYIIRRIDRLDTITTVAGIPGATGYYNGDGIPARSAKIGASGIGFDNAGNLYIADGNTRVRKVNTAGIISTVAGNGTVGFAGNGGPATAATLDGVVGVCVDAAGNIYLADKNNDQVRKVNASTGIITAFAGTGTAGFSGDGGQATAAKLSGPNAVRIDPQGNVVIADQNNGRIRMVSASGIITTIAGSSSAGGFAGDGGAPTAARLAFPADMAWDTYGNMFIADKGQASTNYGHRVREVFHVDTLHLTANPGDTICGYSHVTYTAHEVRGKHYLSFYKWRLNGALVGYNSPTYFTDSARNGDVITCSMADTANGGFTIAVSDTIRMLVRPVLVPSVSLTSTGDTLCNGQAVTLTAHSINGGTAPAYHWYKFGAIIATGPTLTYIPSVGDIVTCVLVSNAICASPDSVAVSRSMVINISYPPSVTLDPHPNDTIAFWGEIITLFTELSFQGTHPTFQWYKNGRAIAGATTQTYNEEVYRDDTLYCVMYSNAPCVVPDHDTSDIMYISIGKLITSSIHKTVADLKILPNPNNGSFTVSGLLCNTVSTQVQMSVTDMAGKVIYSKDEAVTNGRIDARVSPASPLPAGNYLLNIRSDGGNKVVHFVVEY